MRSSGSSRVAGSVLGLAALAAGAYLALGRGDARSSVGCSKSEYVDYGRPHLALGRESGRDAPFLRRVDYKLIYPGAAPDEIRAIDRPCFERPAAVRGLLSGHALVVGLARGGDVRAYPIDLLSYHEVVNDVVGGVPTAITWCPLCSTALAFERRLGGREFHFGISGLLYQANQILFDRETGSLWSQLLGGAITGPMRGRRLNRIPLLEETWQAWLQRHPDTLVLSIRHDRYAHAFVRPVNRITLRGEHASNEPYDDYESKVGVYYPQRVRGIVDGTLVLGVVVNGRAKAYPLLSLERRRRIEDVLGGVPIVVTYDYAAVAASVSSRKSGARLPATEAYWFAWRRFYPETAVYP